MDVVETIPFESRTYVVKEVMSRSGRKTFRVFFQSLMRWNEIIDEITSLGCTVEARWEQSELIAVDAATVTDCDMLKAYLTKLEKQKEIMWENGN